MELGNPLDLDALEAAGIHVTTVNTKISGATTRLGRPLAVGQRVIIVADCVVDDVGLKGPAAEVKLGRALKANELFALESGAGMRVLAALRAANVEVDTTKGHEELPGMVTTVNADGVVVTEAEKAALTGAPVSDVDLAAALAWARENFGAAFDADPDGYVEALDGIGVLEPWALEYLLAVERGGDEREDVIDALIGRLDEELERCAGVEPWKGFGKAGIDEIRGAIEARRVESSDSIVWRSFLEHVRRFEEANKGRKGVLDFIATFVAAMPDNDDEDDLDLDDPAAE
ncbi:MAG: hypothetical protein WEA75_04725 [Acidimicrobiia bacterium]